MVRTWRLNPSYLLGRRPVFDPATLKKLAKAIGNNGSDVVAEDDES
jgi:hypothetical protein